MSRTCFINVGIGEWYTHGSDRLKSSLLAHQFPGDVLIWKDWPERPFNRSNIYCIKPAAFQQVIDAGYTTIIWGDSSIYAQANTQPFVDEVNRKGYWLGQSGYNAAQTCSDACLDYFGVTRDWAEGVHDSATGLFGVNINYPLARQFIELWIKAGQDGAFNGSRHHDGQSKDKRFKFGRQDQSCASIIAGKLGMKLDSFGAFVAFKWDAYPAIFRCEGM